MKSDKPSGKLPTTVTYRGVEYVSVDALVALATDKQALANVATMLKVGADQKTTLADALAHALAGFVLQASGRCKGIEFTSVEMAAVQSMLDQKFTAVGVEG